MQRVLMCSVSYAKCPYYLELYMQKCPFYLVMYDTVRRVVGRAAQLTASTHFAVRTVVYCGNNTRIYLSVCAAVTKHLQPILSLKAPRREEFSNWFKRLSVAPEPEQGGGRPPLSKFQQLKVNSICAIPAPRGSPEPLCV